MSKQDDLINSVRDHPMAIVGFFATAFIIFVFYWHLATEMSELPSVPFIYNL